MDLRSGGPLVVGVDGSPDSVRALNWALGLAAPLALPVRVLHARGRRHADRASSLADDLLVDALADYAGPTARVTAADDDSDPVPLLLEAGEGATAVIVGARGHGRLSGAVTGSVSQHVAQLATCPVVVVRPPADQLSRMVVLGVDEALDEPGRQNGGDGARLRGRVQTIEALGPELLAYVNIEAQPVLVEDVLEGLVDAEAAEDLAEIKTDAGGAPRATVVARLDAAARVRPDDPIDLDVDLKRLHFFDLETGDAIFS